MTVLFSDDFSGALDPSWTQGSPGELSPPDTSGGVLRLHGPSAALYAYSTSVVNYPNDGPIRCTIWTWELADVPLADIYAGDFFSATFQAAGSNALVWWSLRWQPATVPPPETPGTDTDVMIYPAWQTFYPPVTASGAGTPVTFSMASHKWLRIREECHDVLWQVSADGATWADVYTHTLDGAFVYESDYAMTIGMRSGLTPPPFTLEVEGVSIEKYDACLCPEASGGWHVGRAAMSTSGPW